MMRRMEEEEPWEGFSKDLDDWRERNHPLNGDDYDDWPPAEPQSPEGFDQLDRVDRHQRLPRDDGVENQQVT